jgi:LysM repeat protein
VKKAAAYNVEAGVIRVNGDKVLVLKTKDSANKLLNDILNTYVKNGQTTTDYKFKLEVQTAAEFVDSQEITSYDEAFKKLTQTAAEKKQYTVKSGDTVHGIASKYSMSVNELFTLNPEIDEKSMLNIGDVLNVTEQVPFLEVEYIGSAK